MELRRLSTVLNAGQVPAQAAAIALAERAPLAGRAMGVGAAATGIHNLVRGDRARISTVGSAAQTVGGLTMAMARNPVTLTRGATAVVAGSLLNLIDQHVAERRPSEAAGLKGFVITGAVGAILAGREVSPAGVITAGVIGGAIGFLWSECKGEQPRRDGMAPLMLRLRASH